MNKLIDTKTITLIICSSLVSSCIITIMHNLDINGYFKYFIFPISILIINYGFIIKTLNLKINKNAYILLIPIILIMISDFILEVNITNLTLNIFILPILISMFFLMLINDNYHISRTFIKWFFKLFPSKIFSNLKYIKDSYISKIGKKKKKILNIFIGLCVALPLAFLLLGLLISADRYFSTFIEAIKDLLPNITNIDVITQNIFILVSTFIVFFTILINVLKNKDTEEKVKPHYKINSDILKTILIIINTVFVLFLVSEISKLTVNFLSLPIEYTYAKYAREGFFQLLFVTLINFSIISYYIYYVDNIKENKMIKYLLMTLVGFSILLVFNSYYRMFLYISNYGFTILRLQVILFLFMEIILFIIILKKIIYKLKNKDSVIFLTIIVTTYILNLYFCVKPFIKFLND